MKKSSLFVWWVFISSVTLSGCWFMSSVDLTSAQAQHLSQRGARLVDVRSTEEFLEGHLKGAINIPVSDLQARVSELFPKDGPIVVYCKSGFRAGRAKSILEDEGFSEVVNIGNQKGWPL